MHTELKVDSEVAHRLQAFINSDLFVVKSHIAKSQYWNHFADLLRTTISNNSIGIEGISGFYVPKKISFLHRIPRNAWKFFFQPLKALKWAVRQFMAHSGHICLMSYEKAFDAVMSCAIVADEDLSPFRINHDKLAQNPKIFTNTASLKQHFMSWSGYEASDNIINHYYYLNILRGYIDERQLGTVLEIGAGNGNFPAILYHDWTPNKVILIDLPETLAIAIPYLSSLFPKAKLLMPNEIEAVGLSGIFDFAFLTVDQIEFLQDNSIDLAINCHSFQEMTHEQIEVYFKLIQRVCRESAFFFTANRVEKIPCGKDPFTVEQLDPPNRFAEYPWNLQNETLVYEISRLHRLVQLDNISIRLESIHK